MRLAFLGLGLIGGSLARAMRAVPSSGSFAIDEIVAWSPSGAGPAAAQRDGIIDRSAPSPPEAIRGANLIVLAGPPLDILGQLDALAGPWHEAVSADAVITDVASTKAAIVERAGTHGLRFVGGHPMAGREASGYAASTADLFVDRPWVIVPSGDAPADERVAALATASRARPHRMTAVEHDEAVAAISHLPLVVAAALVEAVVGGIDGIRADWPSIEPLAASGWRDMTRLARGDVAMGTGIAVTNGRAIARRLRDLAATLDEWAGSLEAPGGPDAEAIAARLASARDRLETR